MMMGIMKLPNTGSLMQMMDGTGKIEGYKLGLEEGKTLGSNKEIENRKKGGTRVQK